MGHAGKYILGPQRPGFPINEDAVIFAKTPSFGISPIKLLKEKFTLLSNLSFPRDAGIVPDKLFEDKSISSRLFNSPNESGVGP
eukprot:Gb_22817 [translate_table: standard]